jgi:hypothetical protein
VNRKTNFRVIAVLNIVLLLCLPILDNLMARGKTKFLSSEARVAQGQKFRLEEATIAEVHRGITAKQITVTQLVNLYLTRIKAYSGTCVQGAVDPAIGLQLGDITPIPNAGQINAFITVNLKEDKRIALGLPERMKRTHTPVPMIQMFRMLLIARGSSTPSLPAPASWSDLYTVFRLP